MKTDKIVAAVIVALGLAAGGWFMSKGLADLRTGDRYVSVKGSAEKVVDADLVVWPLAHTVSGNDLGEVQRGLEANTAAIRDFFKTAGFGDDEIVVAPARLEDRWAYAYGENKPPERYRYSTTVTLRTTKVAKAMEALRHSGDLLAKGVMLGGSGGEGESSGGPQFDYTRLNDIKPALIAEATANARKSAEQFAKDSGAHIGGIRTANQGVVDISNRDAGSPQVKKVRVVSTVEYFLRD
ncbi:MAG: SIMPL domain-containing protein [Proteobacteria bacterium]|nr:SIMPL domain-containing protein [Pseudomonadota bacterium]